MKDNREMEELLQSAPAPRVKAGMHRQLLKARLLSEMEKGEEKMTNVSWRRGLAWACCLALLVTTTAWGGKKIYRIIVEKSENVQKTPEGVKITPEYKVRNADGREITGEERDHAVQLAEEAAGKVRKIRVEAAPGGGVTYIYDTQKPDGTPLEYRSTQDMLKLPWSERIVTDLKKDKKSGKLLFTAILVNKDGSYMFATMSDGSDWGVSPICGLPDLVRQGKGKLLETRKLKDGKELYIYEFTLASGEKARYGSVGKPLTGAK